MTNSTNNKPANKEVKFENMRRLNAVLSSESEYPALLSNIKSLKSKADALLMSQRQKEHSFREKIKKEKDIAENKVAVQVGETPVAAVFDSKKEEHSPETFVDTEQKHLKKDGEADPAKEKATPKTEKQPPKPEKTVPDFIVTRSYEAKQPPSFVKGVLKPEDRSIFGKRPPRPPQGQMGPGPRVPGSRPPQGNRPSSGGTFERKPFERKPMGASTGIGAAKIARPASAKVDATPSKDRKIFDKKKDFTKQHDDKKSMTKRTLIRKGFITDDVDEERMGTRKLKNKKIKEIKKFVPVAIEKAVITTENLTVKILSEKIGKTAQEIIKQLMVLGIMTSINSVVDFPTMELVANVLGVELELKLDKSKEAVLEDYHEKEEDDEAMLVKRPPVITVMGHVDHGKTSLLDMIRKTAVAQGEAGGITQQIGAYCVNVNSEKITFLDTPGHEAFTEMRARGAKVTDIAILVVAADDGVMPQTIEAINHAKAADVPIIVAINKIDKPGANIEKIRQSLTEFGLVPEEWGGDTIMVPISAKRGDGIDRLLEMILFLAEYNNYRANPQRKARCSVIEAKLDKGKGPIANLIVLNGVLRIGDFLVSGTTYGRVRAMVDDKGRNIKEAAASMPVSILGLTDVPQAGDALYVVDDEKTAKQVIDERVNKIKSQQLQEGQKITLDDVFNKISEGNIKELNVVIKADVQGHVEALKTSLLKLNDDSVRVNVVQTGVGSINKSDMMISDISKAILIGYNVRPDAESRTIGEQLGIDVRSYKVIYEAIEDIQKEMKRLLGPVYKETIIGKAQVRNVIKITGLGFIAGSYILSGKIMRNTKARIYRGKEVIFSGNISGLKRFKDDVKEVTSGFECGISIHGFTEFREGDEIEAYTVEEIYS